MQSKLFAALAAVVLNLTGGLAMYSPAKADQTVECREVDDLAEVTHSNTISVTKSISGKECYFSASIKANSSASNQDNAQAIWDQLSRSTLGLVTGQVLADNDMAAIALLLVGPFLPVSLDDPSLGQMTDFLDNNHSSFLSGCLGQLGLEGYPPLDNGSGISCGFVAPSDGSTTVGSFPLAVRANEPVLVIAVDFDGVFYAVFIPASALHRSLIMGAARPPASPFTSVVELAG